MQSRKDGALRKIVMDGTLPMKVRREALGEMEVPSRAFLVKLANDPTVPAKLRLDVSRRLPGAERRISEKRARAHHPPDEEARRREIDHILAEAARELEAAKQETLNVQPVADQLQVLEPQPTAPVAPPDEISSVAPEPAHAAVRIPDSPDDSETKRAELLTQGRTLAAAILHQWQRVWTAPLNQQEQARLDALQRAWANYERESAAHGIDIEKEFDIRLLRPPLQKLPDIARMRHAHGVLEWNLLSLGLAGKRGQKDAEPDQGFWSSAGPGI